MLQRLTEDLEYHELLDRAATCENSLEQLCYVAAFTVSSYSTTVFRTSKPFNPLLGETFELDRLEENGYRSLCEQVKEPQDCGTLPVGGRGGSGGCSPPWVLAFAEIPDPITPDCLPFLQDFSPGGPGVHLLLWACDVQRESGA